MTTPNASERLYDLFLIGLNWLHHDNPNRAPIRGASVFACLQYSNSGFGQAQALAVQSWDLMELVRERSIVHVGSKKPPKQELQGMIAGSQKHNIVLAVPSTEMTPMLFFGPSGYSHAITDAGRAHAGSITDQYAEIITRDSFMHGWGCHVTRMTSYNAKQDPR